LQGNTTQKNVNASVPQAGFGFTIHSVKVVQTVHAIDCLVILISMRKVWRRN